MSDLPDFYIYSQTDLISQTLDYLTERPFYGNAQMRFDIITVDPNTTTDLEYITGKGIIYGGYGYVSYTSTQRDSRFEIIIDGQVFETRSFLQLYDRRLFSIHRTGLYLLQYNDVDYVYTVGLPFDITFESYFKLRYVERHGTTPSVEYYVMYAIVE